MQQTTAACVLLALASIALLYKIFIRSRLSRAKHPSLLGHAKWSRRIARQVAAYSFDNSRFFTSDDAPPMVAEKRRAGLARLTQASIARSPRSLAYGAALEGAIHSRRARSHRAGLQRRLVLVPAHPKLHWPGWRVGRTRQLQFEGPRVSRDREMWLSSECGFARLL